MNTTNQTLITPFDKLMKTCINPWFALGYFTLIAISFFYFDQPIALFFQSLDLTVNAPWLRWITNLGLGGPYLIGLLLCALLFRYVYPSPKWESRSWFLWLCVVIPSIICVSIKIVLGRSRPELLFNDGLYGFYGLKLSSKFWSFPSGHTSTIMGFVFGLCIVFPRYMYAFILTGFTIATSRILLTHHFLSDVLMATYLSFLEISLFYYWVKRKKWMTEAISITHHP